MAGSIKGRLKRKYKTIGRPDRFAQSEMDQWERRGDKLSGKVELPPAEAAMPLPDEEEIKRNRRRGQAARGGGRASTIFTESDRLGP